MLPITGTHFYECSFYILLQKWMIMIFGMHNEVMHMVQDIIFRVLGIQMQPTIKVGCIQVHPPKQQWLQTAANGIIFWWTNIDLWEPKKFQGARGPPLPLWTSDSKLDIIIPSLTLGAIVPSKNLEFTWYRVANKEIKLRLATIAIPKIIIFVKYGS